MGRKLLLVLSLLLVTTSAVAQSTTAGSLAGTVTDSSGAALPGVTVELAGSAMQGVRTVVTDMHGNYRFVNVPPGEIDSPNSFSPQHLTVPSVRMAHECSVPTATWLYVPGGCDA